MVVDTSDYPYAFSKMQGTWGLEQTPAGVLIKMRFDYVPKYGPIGWILDRLIIRRSFRRICEKLMNNWEAAIKEDQACLLSSHPRDLFQTLSN